MVPHKRFPYIASLLSQLAVCRDPTTPWQPRIAPFFVTVSVTRCRLSRGSYRLEAAAGRLPSAPGGLR